MDCENPHPPDSAAAVGSGKKCRNNIPRRKSPSPARNSPRGKSPKQKSTSPRRSPLPGKKKPAGQGRRGKSRRKGKKCRPRRSLARAAADNRQEENAEGEITDDDAIVDVDAPDLVNLLPHDEIGREMRQRGLSDNVLRVQVHPTRLFINSDWPPNNPVDDEIYIEDWLGFDLISLPDTSSVSCGWNYGAQCDFCHQMRPATQPPSESPTPQPREDAPDP